MNPANNQPWLDLPQEVRQRVMRRFKQITGHSAMIPGVDPQGALVDLGKARLIEYFGGNVQAAIKWAADHGAASYGDDANEWREAAQRSIKQIAKWLQNPDFAAEGFLLNQLVSEEMAKRN